MKQDLLGVERKALLINLDQKIFGTFAEIGAGQEVARNFFRAGGAAGTIAKSISAYDMTFSDAIYGKSGRYVSRERLQSMLQREYSLLLERLSTKRGEETQFFVFADTVAARSYHGNNESHGWMGVRFQAEPLAPPNEVIIHVRMTDRENLLQQHALGAIGVNLIYGAFYYRHDPDKFIGSLLDDLSAERIEVDMLEFSGPEFKRYDNRVMSLKLLQHNLTNAIMFAPDGRILQPSEILYKRPVLVERGSFRPVTHVNLDMLSSALTSFHKEIGEKDVAILFEITLNNLMSGGCLDDADFLARADTLSVLGHNVLISDYSEYHSLASYFRRYTHEPIGMVIGINNLLYIMNDTFYKNLEGGILEALGRLFQDDLKLYVYPMTRASYRTYLLGTDTSGELIDVDGMPEVIDANQVKVLPHLKHLYRYLIDVGRVVTLSNYHPKYLSILSRDVLRRIKEGDRSWENDVPAPAAHVIKERGMFDYKTG